MLGRLEHAGLRGKQLLSDGLKLALAVLVVGCAVAILLPRMPETAATAHPPSPSAESEHGAGIDHAMAAILALYQAPPGSTPCESAYNAYEHSLHVSNEQGVKAAVLRLSPRDEFLAGCAALPPTVQACIVRKYAASHKGECTKSIFTDDVNAQLAKIVETVHVTEPVREPPVTRGP